MNQKILDELFSYHPPKNEQEQQKHEIVNKATMQMAQSISEVVNSPAELTTILRQIQIVRMLANAAVCYDRIGISYNDLFKM